MPPAWTDFASEIRSAWVTAMGSDADLGTEGTMGVATLAELTATPNALLLLDSELPYIGAVGVSASPVAHGTMFKVSVELRAVCVAKETTPEGSRALAAAMASRAAMLVWAMNGRAPGTTGHSCLVVEAKASEPVMDEDEQDIASATVSAQVDVCYYETR